MTHAKFSNTASGVLLVWVTLFCAVLFVAWDLYKKRHILKFSKKVNGYKFYPIIGNGYHIVGRNIFSNLRKLEEKFNFPIGVWAGHSFTYITIDVAEIKVILNHQNTFDKHSCYENFEKLFGNSLLLAKFNRWKQNRKLFAKCFSQSILHSFVDVFYEKSSILVRRLEEKQSNNLFELFETLSLENFCATIMGLDWDELIVKDGISDCMFRAQKFLEGRIVSSYYYPDFIAHLSQGGKKFLQATKRIKELVNGVVQKRRETSEDRGEIDDQKQPFVDILLEGTLFDEDDIYREIALFMAAATETSGGTLAFTFTLLGMNPDIQEKVYCEVEKLVGIDGPIFYDDLSNLKYTERAIRESMRLFPIVPHLGRHTSADVDLGTRTIPAGSDIVVSVFNLHRSETYWPNPLEFNPDRFLPEEVAKRHPYSYIPFSAGPSNCLGMKYAMLMMKMTVADVIRNYHITSNYKSVEDLDLTSAISMKTTHELDCVFTPRI